MAREPLWGIVYIPNANPDVSATRAGSHRRLRWTDRDVLAPRPSRACTDGIPQSHEEFRCSFASMCCAQYASKMLSFLSSHVFVSVPFGSMNTEFSSFFRDLQIQSILRDSLKNFAKFASVRQTCTPFKQGLLNIILRSWKEQSARFSWKITGFILSPNF